MLMRDQSFFFFCTIQRLSIAPEHPHLRITEQLRWEGTGAGLWSHTLHKEAAKSDHVKSSNFEFPLGLDVTGVTCAIALTYSGVTNFGLMC